MKNYNKEINLFTHKNIGITCPRKKKWEEMKEVIGGRFCDGCHERVISVKGYTKGEVMALQREFGESICVAIDQPNEHFALVGIPNLKNIEVQEEALLEEY